MPPDYPSDLIRDIKIRLRQAAGVPSYDPGDPNLPSFPSVADSVAALDPTLPDYLRCKRCHGGLVRGINSTICIFCGAEQRGDGVYRTISFNSTLGYRKLLQSLDLDGSEVVNLEAESKESSKGQNSPNGGLTLAKILDLEFRWPREVAGIDNNSGSEAPQVALVSLSGVDLDNFFSDQKNEIFSRSNTSHSTSSAPQVRTYDANSFSVDWDPFLSSTINETTSSVNLSSGSQKFGFSEERQSLDVTNSSANAKSGALDDAFADWETDFQSASSATFDAKSKQIDPEHIPKDFQSANPATVTTESRTMDPFHYAVDYETVGTEPKQIDLFQFLNSEAISTDSRPIDPIQNSAGFQSVNSEAAATEFGYFDNFQNCSGFSPIIISMSDQNTNIGHNFSKDDTDVDLTSKKTDPVETISSAFVGDLKNERDETTSESVSRTCDDLGQSSVNEINNTKSLNYHDDDLFDDWQDSTTASGNLSIMPSLTSDKLHPLPLEVNSGDAEDLEFGCFIQSDSFSVASNDLQSSNLIDTRQGGDSDAHRTNQTNEETGNASAIHSSLDMNENNHDPSDLDASKLKVDMLLAQMPDLSFMLEDSLHIPKKPCSSEPNT
ncbi:uncharacterized protein LOC110023504 [Phalaenopsis equestris]|uniref:uncharacterized protein LOC110023504 n=1 Tax=Phalaenopsis equestris TaxID=78828 RepID=UPI0009E3CCCD|nr:uncharacterized protein LOC110023504 [Phalaenopsis equestris]